VVGIQAPGKGSRLLETPCTQVSELIDSILPSLLPALDDKPFSFFGHSNGALFAFELCCTLQARGLPLPEQLLISASPAPWTRVIDRPYSSMPVAEFRDVLKDLNGTPAEVLEDPELFELVLPGLRADFALAENYRFEHSNRLGVPTSVFWGEHDRIEERQIQAWQDQIEHPLRLDRIPGGHFFIHSHVELLTGLIGRRLVGGSARTPALAHATG
jgi:medium-chain acyl-[acyl-carrier-protein] hydrolase